jgi:hypothetical protein
MVTDKLLMIVINYRYSLGQAVYLVVHPEEKGGDVVNLLVHSP